MYIQQLRIILDLFTAVVHKQRCSTRDVAVQARDVEASLQEQLLEQFHELVLARAVAAGSTGRSQTALAAAAAAADLLRPILAVLPASGAAGSTCLGRACGALHAKKRLKGKAAATGLQNIIQQLTAQGAVLPGCTPLLRIALSGFACSSWHLRWEAKMSGPNPMYVPQSDGRLGLSSCPHEHR